MDEKDEYLIERYRNGDEDAFRKLLYKYKVPIFTYILRMVKNKTIAEDIFQDVWIKIINILPKYREEGKFNSLIFKVAFSKCTDYLRKNKKEIKLHKSFSDPSDPIDLQKEIEKKDLLTHINNAVENLSIEQREVFLLRQYSNLTFKEISKILNLPLGTVLSRMHLAMLSLRESLKELV